MLFVPDESVFAHRVSSDHQGKSVMERNVDVATKTIPATMRPRLAGNGSWAPPTRAV